MGKEFYKKILVAINGSETSIHAAMYAIMMAATYKLQLKVVYVVDSATIKYLGLNQILIHEEEVEFQNDLVQEGSSYLDYVQSLAASKGLEIEKDLRQGTVYTEILKSAQEYEADLILIGGHERKNSDSLIKKTTLSQNRNELLAKSRCPVLVVQKSTIQTEFNQF
ncbi:MAG: universal stress protein [Treponema sp.]|nr:universal stress protein [Treponema sp.]